MDVLTALLIIDAQSALLSSDSPAARCEQVLSNLNLAIAKARAVNMPVIFVQHDGPEGSPLAPDSDGWQIHPQLNGLATDYIVRKTVGDSFYAPQLHNLLKKRGVRRLWIGGSATDFCVDTAVRAALSHDYEVTVIADGHTCRDRPLLKGETVIDYFNWVWSEMSEAPQALRVITADALQA